VQEICPLRAMWRVLETGLRQLLNGHEGGNAGYSQGVSYGLGRLRPTLPDGLFSNQARYTRHRPRNRVSYRQKAGRKIVEPVENVSHRPTAIVAKFNLN
jgi:hypothetical protein